MLESNHTIIYSDSRDLAFLPSESINLVVTSPPYPIIAMWDDLFGKMNPCILEALENHDGMKAFDLMHLELDKVWCELYRVLTVGSIACINIGDAVRTLAGRFHLYSNHARILMCCINLGFDVLPAILWRKQTNAPNKFMGSGMLPPGAYVTLEHEYILILRKGNKRVFSGAGEKRKRYESAYFWEERNIWFSDIWDFKGVRQSLNHSRERSGAFPFELAYRLINMYSCEGDTVLDPFLGTGTTTHAAMASCRSSIGVEIEDGLSELLPDNRAVFTDKLNEVIYSRLQNHLRFVGEYEKEKRKLGHRNGYYDFPVMTRQETDIKLHFLDRVILLNNHKFRVQYVEKPSFTPPGFLL